MRDATGMFLQMGRQYQQSGRTDEAEANYLHALRLDPDDPEPHELLGLLYLQQERLEQARQHLERAVAGDDANPQTIERLAMLCQDLGDFAAAERGFRRLMTLGTDQPASYWLRIAQIRRFESADDTLRDMERAHEAAVAGGDERMYLGFALGKAYDELGDYARAFGYFAEANRIASQKHPYAARNHDAAYRPLADIFTRDFIERYSPPPASGPVPIFVTGLPRSGSTLVEQILASHSAVHGAGELSNLHDIVRAVHASAGTSYPEGCREAPPAYFDAIARRYLAELRTIAPEAGYVTDKNMGAVIYMGLIFMLFPQAKIIHTRRDLRDQGLSCYQKYFGKQQPYSYDLQNIATYAVARERAMTHWKTLMPGRIFSVRYEELVADPETGTRALLDYCGLPFEPACLASHRSGRTVKTFSLEQVRRPVYASSVGRWRHYASELQPLVDALAAAGTPE